MTAAPSGTRDDRAALAGALSVFADLDAELADECAGALIQSGVIDRIAVARAQQELRAAAKRVGDFYGYSGSEGMRAAYAHAVFLVRDSADALGGTTRAENEREGRA